MSKKAALIPTLKSFPLATLELVDGANLSAADRTFLEKQEKTIAAGWKTFVEVGTALKNIHDYKDGLLYKRFGTFEDYCREQWEFGRAYAYRLMDAAEIYIEMSPRGDKNGDAILPSSEKQIRALKRLPSKELRKEAWSQALESAGEVSPHASDVAKAVRKVQQAEGIEPSASKGKRKARPVVYRLEAADLAKIHKALTRIRERISKLPKGPDLSGLLDEIEGLLPGPAGK